MRISRRAFGQWLLSFIAIPRMRLQLPEKNPHVPETVAGHPLTPEERDLVSKFLATHEKHISPLREQDLPNDLPPDVQFIAPSMKADEEGQR